MLEIPPEISTAAELDDWWAKEKRDHQERGKFGRFTPTRRDAGRLSMMGFLFLLLAIFFVLPLSGQKGASWIYSGLALIVAAAFLSLAKAQFRKARIFEEKEGEYLARRTSLQEVP